METTFLSVTEIAELLHVSRSRAYQLLSSGEVPNTRVGGRIRVPVAAWNEWVGKKAKAALVRARELRAKAAEAGHRK